MGNSFSLCRSPWSSDTCFQSCRYPQVPDSCWKQWEFNSSSHQVRSFFGVKWFYRSRWKERGYLQGIAEVCVMGEMAEVSPASLYFLPKYWEAAECLMLAPEMIQHPKVGKAKLASGRNHRYVCHLMALAGVRSDKEATQSGLMPRVSWGLNKRHVSFAVWASLLCWELTGAFAGSGRQGIMAMKSFCKLCWRRVMPHFQPPHPRALNETEKYRSVPWNQSFRPGSCTLTKGRSRASHHASLLAPADPAGCTACTGPPARTCVCRRRGWHQSY